MVVGFSFMEKGDRNTGWEECETAKMLDWNYWHELLILKSYLLSLNAKRA